MRFLPPACLFPHPLPSAGACFRRQALRALFAGACVVLAACASIAPHVAGPVTPMTVDAAKAARMINAFRAANGLKPVRVDARLMRAATSYAQLMGARDAISHTLGPSLPRRVTAVGYDWGFVAENLGASYPTLDDVIAGWKNSPGHRANMLSPYATDIGIAAVSMPPGSSHRDYWALELAMPQPEHATRDAGGWLVPQAFIPKRFR